MAVSITLMGDFAVHVDGVQVPDTAWTRPQAATLVKVLALAPGRRMHREELMEVLWPGSDPSVAGPRLHKAAHYARRAVGAGAVLLRHDLVALLPDDEVVVDVPVYAAEAREALRAADPTAAARVSATWAALLPQDRFAAWAQERRDELQVLQVQLLRLAGQWDDLLRLEPADEEAHVTLARRLLAEGSPRAAERQLERLERALRRELGAALGPEAAALREELRQQLPERPAMVSATARAAAAAGPVPAPRLVGRRDVGDRIRQAMAAVEDGAGRTLVLTGAPGVGKTAILDLAETLARRAGWLTARGAASSVQGSWSYAPVLEAVADLSRGHPELLAGLERRYHTEIQRALAAEPVRWSGESTHRRLFLAVSEALRIAAAQRPLLLLVDDLHDADEASLRLLHYLSKVLRSDRVLLALAHRPDARTARAATGSVLHDLEREDGSRLELHPLAPPALVRLLGDRYPDLAPQRAERIAQVSWGLPRTALALARDDVDGVGPAVESLSPEVSALLHRLAVVGPAFTSDELLAVSTVEEDETYSHLDVALSLGVVEQVAEGYRFTRPEQREELLSSMPLTERRRLGGDVATRLEPLSGPPARLARLYLDAGSPAQAVPFVVRAVEADGAMGAYRHGVELIDAVREHAGPEDLPGLLARRGDLLNALGDAGAVQAYRDAAALTTGTQHRLVRARMARAAVMRGEFEVATAALAGLEVEGDEADAPILLAQGNLAIVTDDIEAAWAVTTRARELLTSADDPWQLMDLIALQGLIAHQRGEWFDRFHVELRRSQGQQRLVEAIFDAHLCVAEFLLYGPVPYAQLIDDVEDLRRRSKDAGALRGVGFATSLIGEAALLMGDLDRAEHELTSAVALHREADSTAGEAHALQRLSEVSLARGDAAAARRMLRLALPLARWSSIASHLLPRVYGTLIQAAEDPQAALAVVRQAEEIAQHDDPQCHFCRITLAVPAAIAAADAGDLATAARQVAIASAAAKEWHGHAWQAALDEARAHIARAEGNEAQARDLWQAAAAGFTEAGQPLDTARCAAAVTAAAS